MDYRLAKKLKDAGFSQPVPTKTERENGFDIKLQGEGKGYMVGSIDNNDLCYVPTLEELIDACGDKFFSLIKRKGGWEACSSYLSNESGVSKEEWVGPTMSEAVTNLWLALNKK